jgi:BirA family biotin operon repressor/biotin-[acetyl-CoA-carboxylase] ligase
MTIVTASEQTGGRGRFKRHWVSPPNQNIYASFCFFVEHYGKEISNIPQIMALSAAHSLEQFGLKPEIKWPNDVLLSKKKVAGILAETTAAQGAVCVVVGIGVNVNMPQEVLGSIDRPATSLLVETGKQFDVNEVLKKLVFEFSKDLDTYFLEGFPHFIKEYRQRIVRSISSPVRFHDNVRIWEGSFDSIEDDGALTLQFPDGTRKTFLVGEILWE